MPLAGRGRARGIVDLQGEPSMAIRPVLSRVPLVRRRSPRSRSANVSGLLEAYDQKPSSLAAIVSFSILPRWRVLLLWVAATGWPRRAFARARRGRSRSADVLLSRHPRDGTESAGWPTLWSRKLAARRVLVSRSIG